MTGGMQYHGVALRGEAFSAPFVMQPLVMPTDVLSRMQGQTVKELENDLLRSGSVHETHSSGDVHRDYEGFYHALPTADRICSPSPKAGRMIWKRAAPPALRALMLLLRQQATPPLLHVLSAHDGSLSRLLREVLERGSLFGDFAVQVHSGAERAGKDIFWHVDHPVSSVHLGISLFGHRTLHISCDSCGSARLHQLPRHEQTHLLNCTQGCAVSTSLQTPGRLYYSSPAVFKHGVEYPTYQGGRFASSIVAIQARLLANTTEERRLFDRFRDEPGGHKAFVAVAKAMRSVPISVPTLEDLLKAEARLPVEVARQRTQSQPSLVSGCGHTPISFGSRRKPIKRRRYQQSDLRT